MANTIALQRLFLLLFTALLFVAKPLVAHSHHGHAAHNKIHRLHDQAAKRNASSIAGNGTTAAAPGSVADAEDIIARFHQSMAVANQAILENPSKNEYSPEDSKTQARRARKPDPLRYPKRGQRHGGFARARNGTFVRRDGANSTTSSSTASFTGDSYTVPTEVIEAARIIAEANPLPPKDYDTLLAPVRAKVAEVRPPHNATFRPPQKLQSSPGLMEYVPLEELAITYQNGTQVAGPVVSNYSVAPDHSARLAKRTGSGYWQETMAKRGSAPYAGAGYQVWRNVKDFGAYGDGIHDDTAAINLAITSGSRCGAGCSASTEKPATVFFPGGTYLVSSSIIQYYNTEFLGDPLNIPVILAAPSFVGLGVITSNQYVTENTTWYLNQNNFLRSIRNFIIDVTATNQWAYVCGLHWQVAQASSLENIVFWATSPDDVAYTTQQGIYMENGSGGFMSGLTFFGGNFGAYFGNQQFTTSDLFFMGVRTGLQIHWDWGWTLHDAYFLMCQKAVVIVGGAGGPGNTDQGVGSLALVDVRVDSTPIAVETSLLADNSTALYIQNCVFGYVDTIIYDSAADSVLYAGDAMGFVGIEAWGFGQVADPTGEVNFVNGDDMPAPEYPETLLNPSTAVVFPHNVLFHRRRPDYSVLLDTEIMDVKALGAKGDGITDDTATLNYILSAAANISAVVYFPYGVYVITDTLYMPVGSRIIGQAWPQIMATGTKFQNMASPKVAVRVGDVGDVGILEIQCMLFTVRGPTAGAVLVEWNVHEIRQGAAGMWDTHFRVGGAAGSDLQASDCPKGGPVNTDCVAASLLMHMTERSSAYLENVWMWVADHDFDDEDQTQIDVYVGRGILIESQGPTWLWGTAAEHAVLYQYQLAGAKDIVMGLIQTEAPYFQPTPKAPDPFENGLVFREDPTFDDCPPSSTTCAVAWSVRVIDSTDVYILSAGLYTWFSSYSQTCINSGDNDCQQSTFYVEQSSDIWVWNLFTIGSIEMITPHSGDAVIAANNRNGFASSIVMWEGGANRTAGERNFTGYQLYTSGDLGFYDFSSQCKTALGANIHCHSYTVQWTTQADHSSLSNETLREMVCDPGCGASLAAWYKGVRASCPGLTWPSTGAPLEMVGGYVWYGFNETCQVDALTGRYCNDIIDEFPTTSSLLLMNTDDLCHPCFVERVLMMQKSPYSIYNTLSWYQMVLGQMKTRCSSQVSGSQPTATQAPLIPSPTASPFCVSNSTYTTVSGDTCDSIAIAHDVSSADIFHSAYPAFIDCQDLPVGVTLCLPLSCDTYVLGEHDDCSTASENAGVSDITDYNAWLDPSCENLHEVNATLGTVLCASPPGGAYVPGTPTNTSQIPHTYPPRYSTETVEPPANSTVAPGTETLCGQWHVAEQGDTCAYITVTYRLSLATFGAMNPSVDTTGGGCSESLAQGNAYCVLAALALLNDGQGINYTAKPLGCFENLRPVGLVLWGSKWTSENETFIEDDCAYSCVENRFALFGLVNKTMCICGDRISLNSVKLSDVECTSAQTEHGATSVFGLSENTVLDFQFRYVGCFANSALLTGVGPDAHWPTNNTASNCAAYCLPTYPYFGVTNGDTCRCWSEFDSSNTPVDAAKSCNVLCSGDEYELSTCGGLTATLMYSTREEFEPSPAAVSLSLVSTSVASSVVASSATSASSAAIP